MLFAASESAVTKKPRLRLTMRRSSSVRPSGSFHSAMSRDMLISCGIQWLAQVARYFSQAHLYLKGTSWLTSVCPLMIRFSATLTRRVTAGKAGPVVTTGPDATAGCNASDAEAVSGGGAACARPAEGTEAALFDEFVAESLTSSSQTSMSVCFLRFAIIGALRSNT